MLIKELWNTIEKISPLELSEEWDNSGPQISFDDDEITKIIVALEVTYDVIKEAISEKANCIITHHPLFFEKAACITPEYTIGAYTLELVKNRISVYSAHTNFDNLVGGNNDCFGEIIGVKNIEVPDIELGIYRIANIPSIKIKDLMDSICDSLSIEKSFIHLIGNTEDEVSRIAWCTGAGFDFIYDAYNDGAECYITGDVKYHDARDAHERGMNVIDVGHYGSEKIFTKNMADKLRNEIAEDLILESKEDKDPFTTL